MKIATIVGARPQFIKAATISRAISGQSGISEVLIHTGQHFDNNMSDVFFSELDIRKPDHHLGIGGGTHGENTGRMLEAIEKVLMAEKPDWTLVYGDTDSTLAGALAAVKLHIPLAHVEAGLRSFNRRMPEEINRVLTDHASDLLFVPTSTAIKNLTNEGTWLNAKCHEADEQGFSTTGNGDAVLCTGIGSQSVFQLFDFWPHDILTMVQHALNALINFGLECLILRFKVNKRNYAV